MLFRQTANAIFFRPLQSLRFYRKILHKRFLPAYATPTQGITVSKPQVSTKWGGAKIRQTILFSIFGVGLVLLGYDFGIARPACDNGDEQLQSLLKKYLNATSDQQYPGPDDVHKILGRGPTETTTRHDRYLIETYRWRSGALYRTYNLYVVYRGLDKPALQAVLKNEYPSEEDTPFKAFEPTIRPDKPLAIAPASKEKA